MSDKPSIAAADIQAATDVLCALNDTYDFLDAAQAIEMLQVVRALQVQVKAAESNLQSQALGKMETQYGTRGSSRALRGVVYGCPVG